MPYMQVNRVLFEGKRAVGVEASQLGEAQELRAEREVILCGGAYNSPQLLMLSGVGPAEHLTMREVEVLLDQPAVGENLGDHPATYAVWTTPEPESLLLALEPAAMAEFEASQTGPFASNLAESGGFARVGAGAEAPDVQFHVAPIQIVEEGMGDPQAHGVWVSPCLLTAGEPRLGAARLQPTRPRSRSSATPSTTPRPTWRGWSTRCAWRRRSAPSRPSRPTRPIRSPRPADDSDDALRAHIARDHLRGLPPGRHLRDRLGRRLRAAGRGRWRRCGSSTPR